MKRHWSAAGAAEVKKDIPLPMPKAASFPEQNVTLDENANVANSKDYQVPQSSQDVEWPSTVPVTDSVDDDVPYLDHLPAVLYPMSAKLPKIELKRGEMYKVGRITFDQRNPPFPDQEMKFISKVHFTVKNGPALANSWVLQDCSTNGLFINGKKVPKESDTVLENRMEISLGLQRAQSFCFINRDALDDERVASQYLIGRKLGSGGIGTVHRCFRVSDGFPMAMKIIAKQTREFLPEFYRSMQVTSQKNRQQNGGTTNDVLIQREVEILRKLSELQHPHIVKMHDVFDRREKVLLVMELCLEDLASFVRSTGGVLPENHSKTCMEQVLVALNFLHSNQIIHRDLKLENILIAQKTPSILVKLADFGLSKTVDRSEAKTICGTMYYMAPEIIKAHQFQQKYTEKVDCWSAGVVMFCLLQSNYPFIHREDRGGKSLVDSILMDHVKFDPKINASTAAQELCLKLLTKNPRTRFDASRALQHHWFCLSCPKVVLKPSRLDPHALT